MAATAPDTAELVRALAGHGVGPGTSVGLAVTAGGAALAVADGTSWDVSALAAPAAVRAVDAALRPRWVWWSARDTLAPLLVSGSAAGPATGVEVRPATGLRATVVDTPPRVRACWDLAAVHRLLAGGWRDAPELVWATASGLPLDRVPVAGQLDLLDRFHDDFRDGTDDDGDPAEPVRPDGYLRPDWAGGGWRLDPERTRRWAALALTAQAAQVRLLAGLRCGGDASLAARSESAAALLAVELGHDGLPVDRAVAEQLLATLVGPRPRHESDARQARSDRDERVRRLAPPTVSGADPDEVDLRNPAQVRRMLARAGLDLPDTRSWRLERCLEAHPVVPALLAWRKTERIATTYGYDWLDRHVSPTGRLRGAWTASDGGAGRMTAQTGLHNLPAEMRVAVVAEPGQLLVRADLGQVEPRVLAAVSGDAALAAAARDDDLYQPVADRIGCTRAVAKVAVLAAMYGQTSGAAGQALEGMKRAYPAALAFLTAADEAGRSGRDIRTYGGRLVTAGRADPPPRDASDAAQAAHRSAVAARGRYLRNAVVQGAAAELFKAWAATVRAELLGRGTGAIVLCLHDELLLQVCADDADAVASALEPALQRTAARWFRAAAPVRFVADVSVVPRWSDAKG